MSHAAVSPFVTTSIGKKYLMALSGAIWAGFVFTHMAGNLLILVSADAYNKYGHAITSGSIIYPVEILLVLALIVHVALAIILTKENRAARGQKYAVQSNGKKGATLASRTMAVTGSLVLFFIINHLIMFKF